MSQGDYITDFILNAGRSNVDLVLVFSSFKYWRSWFCMAEFDAMIESLSEKGKSFQESVLLIEHESGRIHSVADQTPIENHWRNLETEIVDGRPRAKTFPAMFRQKKIGWDDAREASVDLIVRHAPTVSSNAVDLRREWKPEKAKEIIDWIKTKLELPTR
jgi:hypothetical protein